MKTAWGVKTDFSMGESILQTDKLFKRAKELGYERVAIADHMSITAIIDATKEAEKAGVELITGVELHIQHWSSPEKRFNLRAYCVDGASFEAIMRLLSKTQRDGLVKFVTWNDFVQMLREARFLVTFANALYALTERHPFNDAQTIINVVRDAQSALHDEEPIALELFGVGTAVYVRMNLETMKLWELTGRPLTIISGEFLYEMSDQAKARDVMGAILKNVKLDEPRALRRDSANHAMKTFEDVRDRCLVPVPSLDPRLKTVTEHLAYKWEKSPVILPSLTADDYAELVRMCKGAWDERIKSPVLGYQPPEHLLPEYVQRLKYELGTLNKLGFCNYFLLVADLVRWSKQQGIVVGPGRGSVGGSLVAFLVGITEVDPIRFNLLFERFINPERLDLPDADLDFMSARRHEVIDYLRGKYGVECVAQISNYNTLGPASAIGEVAKALSVPIQDVLFKSSLPKEHGQSTPLIECVETVPDLQTYVDKHPEEWGISLALEGALRSMGTHAAGVIVASEPIKHRAVLTGEGDYKAVCWDKRVVEDQGLVKIDILGLQNLDLLSRAITKIEYNYGKTVNLLNIDLQDAKTMEAFGRGETTGVFQFESGGMRKLLKDLRKGGELTFEDLAAATSLFRPGPLDSGMLDDYVAVRQGIVEPHYDHSNMEPALEPTFGVVVYQEQVMQLARDLAGFTMAEADNVRKAMGKKDREKMAKIREQWVEGCKKTSGLDPTLAGNLFDKIEAFAGYGFNKSHAVEYSIISVWTMYLKVNYPHEYYAAALEIFDEEKLPGVVRDALKHGIEILPPDINESTRDFKRVGDHLLTPFNRVKGIAETTENAILEARELVGGKFESVEHLIENVERRRCNTRHRAHLEAVGAFASITPGSTPARHPDRLRDQKTLLPGLIAEGVRADRAIIIDEFVKGELTALYTELRDKGAIVLPRFGKKPKIMVVLESPNYKDEKAGRLLDSDSAEPIKEALKAAGLTVTDVYVTTYLKKPKADKLISAAELEFSKPYFARELELLKPPVIITVGNAPTKALYPDEVKGALADSSGAVAYSPELDASVVLCINPGMVYFDPTKQELINEAFRSAAELIS